MNKEEKGASITIQASGFPLSAFKEWDESCKKDFGDCRWVKIMHDHKMANNNQMVNLLLDRIENLEHQLSLLTSDDKEEIEPGVRTLGGELK
jgi:predicted nucleotide-binding protein